MRLVLVLAILGFVGIGAVGAKPKAKAKHSPALVELAKILSSGKPTPDPARPARYKVDPHWNPRRVWLLEVREQGTKIVIHGGAASDVDIAEFAKRLATSRLFADVTPNSAEREHDRSGTPYYAFEIAATAVGADPDAPLVVTKTW